jgi:transmembrane sensor
MRERPTDGARSAEMPAREAHAWVLRLTSGEATSSDLAAFKRWHATAEHRRAFTDAKLLWRMMRPAAEQSLSRSALPGHLKHRLPAATMGRRAFLGGAVAASVAGVAVVATRPPLGLWPSVTEMTSDYRTAKGETREIQLAEVLVSLNTQTSIALLPVSGDTDRIELVSGEAAVSAERTTRSFTVLAGRGRATGRNAAFNVRHTGSSACVSCLSGEVLVEHGDDDVKLGPGQQVSFDPQGLQSVVATDLAVVSAWQHGMLVFRSDPLHRVIAEVNRYRRGRIVLMNEELGRKQVFANFRIDRIDEVVPRLQSVFAIRVRSLPGGIVLLG